MPTEAPAEVKKKRNTGTLAIEYSNNGGAWLVADCHPDNMQDAENWIEAAGLPATTYRIIREMGIYTLASKPHLVRS